MSSESYTSIWDISVTDINGTAYPKLGEKFGTDKPKLSIVVNVASECGLTESNYSQLTEIQKKYKDQGFEVLAFPCNQFGAQEPGSNSQIFEFVCTKYSANFHLFDKIDVNGENTHELYQYLKSKGGLDQVTWNFGKFLIDQQGNFLEYADPEVEPNELIPKIEKYLSN
ncbi:glutathione peroxidase [Stylonychia lemnae]|uniref:Glutathione peroxidase n=1 Tax=Stylonychia lemnae TaxID=5949 RepID=A0A078AZQ8_STYLE|nr:glutathione peroxidase [Stylonychia lemnae]|eukprot:CDW86682.1 glutathione peroxidase [Stylonychia lemnae]